MDAVSGSGHPTRLPDSSQQQVLAGLLHQHLDSVVVTDPSLSITEYAGGAEQLYGWTRAEAIGRPWLTLVPTEITGAVSRDVAELLRGERDIRAEARVRRKDGTWIEVQVSATPLLDAGGRLTGWLGIGRDVTQEKEAARQEHQARERLALVLDGAEDAFVDWDVATGSKFFSPRLHELLGYTPSDPPPSLTRDVIHPSDQSAEAPHLEALLRGESARHDYELRLRHKTGRWVWVRVRVKVVQRGEDGRPLRIAGTLSDISAARATAEALRASESRFRDTLESLIEGCMIVGRDWTYLFVNDAMASYCQMPLARMVGRKLPELFPGVESTEAFACYERCMSERVPQQLENAFTFADGRVGWFEQRVYPVPEGICVVAMDITARKATEQALKESDATLRAVVENASEAINLLDLRTGRYVFMNPRQVELTGFTQEEMENLPAADALDRVHPEDRHISEEQQRRIAAGEDPLRVAEYRWRVKSGDYRWFRDSRTLVRDRTGQPIALVGVSRDITEEKRAEDAVRVQLDTNRELVEQLRSRKSLARLLSICMFCKRIHDTDGHWERLEEYISKHSDTIFSHGLCPDCIERFMDGDQVR